MFLSRVAALAEILLVLALGNIIGEALYPLVVSEAVVNGTASDTSLAFAAGLLIFMRLGSAAVLGFAILYYRTGMSPRAAGLTRNNRPMSELVKLGVVMGLISGFLVSLLFLVHSFVPLGNGLAAWWTYDETPINTAFLISVLGTSVLIPPLTEEILFRGYNRARLVESYGPMSGVILTGLVFGLSHTRYLEADGMMLLFMCGILISSVLWTYLAQKTGSVIPPMIAHALANGIGTAVLFNVWIPFIAVTIGVAIFRVEIWKLLTSFVRDLKQDDQRGSFWQGLAIIIIILVAALVMLSQLGRTPTLIVLGAACLSFTIGYMIWEKINSGKSGTRKTAVT
jgi:membrane protease YdiL (CAAX protease family)